jgi:hypothetical protein
MLLVLRGVAVAREVEVEAEAGLVPCPVDLKEARKGCIFEKSPRYWAAFYGMAPVHWRKRKPCLLTIFSQHTEALERYPANVCILKGMIYSRALWHANSFHSSVSLTRKEADNFWLVPTKPQVY